MTHTITYCRCSIFLFMLTGLTLPLKADDNPTHSPVSFTKPQQRRLISLARSTIEDHLRNRDPDKTEPSWVSSLPIVRVSRGIFVTLEKNGSLRGCIGHIYPQGSILESIRECAVSAAVRDSRFPPVTLSELKTIAISISILDYPIRLKAPNPADYAKMLKPGRDGVIIKYRGRSSTYLPQVWDDLPDPVQFLSHLCQKQGAPADAWKSPEAAIYRYSAYVFGEGK
jgi:AmmeMemoRadiSam system protein A